MQGNIEDWRKAGRIAGEVREYSKTIVKPGVKLIDVARQIDAKIASLGGAPAFPVNLSLNDIAAHQIPTINDDIVLKDQLLKVDIGVHINGCIGDTAVTIDLSGNHAKLVEASQKALEAAIKTAKIGATLGQIGKAIMEATQSYGYQPVKNLSGHGMAPYVVHTKPSVPNYDTGDDTKLEKGMIIAIEPFATDGQGMIQESGIAEIFSQMSEKRPRSDSAREILKHIQKYKNLPFAKRWLAEEAKMPLFKLNFGLRELVMLGVLQHYPPLKEVKNGFVAQAEHTLLIDDTVEILTKFP